ncbi:hypothetical protein G8B26_07320, partial [Limosilactobacillus reuteri]
MRYVLGIEKKVDNISGKTTALIGNDFIDLTSEKIISEEQDEDIVFKNVLNNNETFNEAFSINIFDTERSEILNTEFEYEDNLKTALLFYCVKQEIPFSTVLSFKTTMNIVSKEEKSIDKAFRNFNQDDIISFAKSQIEQGSSVYTANNR